MANEHRYRVPLFISDPFELALFNHLSEANPEEARRILQNGLINKELSYAAKLHHFDVDLSGELKMGAKKDIRYLVVRFSTPERFKHLRQFNVFDHVANEKSNEARMVYLRSLLFNGFYLETFSKSQMWGKTYKQLYTQINTPSVVNYNDPPCVEAEQVAACSEDQQQINLAKSKVALGSLM